MKAKAYHTGTVSRTITINLPKSKVWKKISNIVNLPEWLVDVKKTIHLSKTKRGVGAVREITFAGGNVIEEHVIDWKNGDSFTYVATHGLPLRVYVAAISLKSKTKNKTQITWQSYINSKKMTKKQFDEFLAFMGTFYEASLENLKDRLESKRKYDSM